MGLLLLALAPAALAGAPALARGEHWLAATLGHRDAGITILVHQPPSGTPRFRIIDLDQLGIPYRSEQRFRHRAEDYVGADALIRHEAHIDPFAKRVHFVTRLRPHSPVDVPADLLLDVRINGVLIGQPLYVQNTGTDLVLPAETLEALRVALPRAYGPFLEDSMPVHALAGENFHLALDRLYLEMTVPAEDFETTQLSPQGIAPPKKIAGWSPSLVLGYNLAGGEDTTGERWHAGLADVAVSSGTVGCRSRHLAQSREEDSIRLDSACIVDWPAIPLSAGIGDNYSAPGSMHQTVAYGGFWIGTDYSLQPYRNLQPSLIVDGNARLPSTLEIWMDQQLGLRQQIPPGPFVVDNLPAVTGAGNLRAVLVDATGRQVLISAPVYSDPRLLGPGILDWRIETGRLRPGLFNNDDRYTDRFASAGARFGITSWLTGELHVERTDAFMNGSVATAFRVSHFGLFEAGVSQSRNEIDEATAQSMLYGYSWRGRYLHASLREIRRDADYTSLGYPAPGSAPTRERTISAGVALRGMSVTLSGIERAFEDSEQRLGNVGVTIRLGNFGQLLLSATRDLAQPDNDALYSAHLTIPLGSRAHTSHSFSRQGDLDGSTNTFSIRPPTDSGAGFRVARDALADDERYFAQAEYRGARAHAGVAARTGGDGTTSWETRLDGAIVASRAGIGLARDDGNSFAMIETGDGVSGVRVLRENQEVTRTGNSGSAIVSGLRAYESNRLSLNREDLPLSSELDTSHLGVVPGRRNVVVAEFGYREERQLMARLLLPAGSRGTIPAGSEAWIDGEPAGLVGFDGTVYLAVPQRENIVIDVRWAKGSCTATAHVPAGQGIQVAGDITCHPQ